MTYSSLFLFDIDGTLVSRAGPHHKEALIHAVRRVTGLETSTDGIPLQGMLDPDIVRRMMCVAGAAPSEVERALPAIQQEAEALYLETCPEIHNKRCPGVDAALEMLAGSGALLALVTGNFTRIGWRKLERAGLHHHFAYGAFGEMAATRGGLAGLAIRKAFEGGLLSPGAPVALVGDSPADVIAAQENGVCSIAVETGITPAAELAALRPDYQLRDLTALHPGMIRS